MFVAPRPSRLGACPVCPGWGRPADPNNCPVSAARRPPCGAAGRATPAEKMILQPAVAGCRIPHFARVTDETHCASVCLLRGSPSRRPGKLPRARFTPPIFGKIGAPIAFFWLLGCRYPFSAPGPPAATKMVCFARRGRPSGPLRPAFRRRGFRHRRPADKTAPRYEQGAACSAWQPGLGIQ